MAKNMTDKIQLRGKVIGHIDSGIYHTVRNPEHYFRKYHGFGISCYAIIELLRRNINKIIITYNGIGGQVVYRSSVEDFLRKGSRYVNPDDVLDEQWILGEEHMKIIRSDNSRRKEREE